MRIFVKLYDKGGREAETHVIACHDTSTTISSLKQEVLRRLGSDADGEQFRLALAGNGAKLCETDAIEGVLRDGDYLCLCTWISGDTCNYNTAQTLTGSDLFISFLSQVMQVFPVQRLAILIHCHPTDSILTSR